MLNRGLICIRNDHGRETYSLVINFSCIGIEGSSGLINVSLNILLEYSHCVVIVLYLQ